VVLDESRQAQRVTFTNGYNARPRLSPDGSELAMVTPIAALPIAVMDLKTRNLRVLTNARQTSRRASPRTARRSSMQP
jgi:TolB protein